MNSTLLSHSDNHNFIIVSNKEDKKINKCKISYNFDIIRIDGSTEVEYTEETKSNLPMEVWDIVMEQIKRHINSNSNFDTQSDTMSLKKDIIISLNKILELKKLTLSNFNINSISVIKY